MTHSLCRSAVGSASRLSDSCLDSVSCCLKSYRLSSLVGLVNDSHSSLIHFAEAAIATIEQTLDLLLTLR